MNSFTKFFVFSSLILLYLGLARSIAPNKFNDNYVFNDKTLQRLAGQETPYSIILVGGHSTGYIIQTHYHKYRIVYGYKNCKEVIARVSSSFRKKNLLNLGTSLLRQDANGKISSNVLPPGFVFVGDKNFGRWVDIKDKKTWKYYRAYRHLKDYLGLSTYRPTFNEYLKVKVALTKNEDFYGTERIFGTGTKIAEENFPNFTATKQATLSDFKKFIQKYFQENFYKKREL